jgi:hypothetical protein
MSIYLNIISQFASNSFLIQINSIEINIVKINFDVSILCFNPFGVGWSHSLLLDFKVI